tara:strand:+ start:23236 stop:25497 length:2262 start_codon:yes stop_codon:yes gene_type:complete
MAETDKNVREERSDDLTTLGIGAGIATGILARTPLARAGKKIFQGIKGFKKGPKPEEEPQIASDKLPDTTTPDDAQKIQKEFAINKAELEENIKVVEEIQQRVKDNPLTLAGRNTGPNVDPSVQGSVLFDTIATFPNMGRKKGYMAPAQAWADYFKTASKKTGVTRDELADTNIALFDKDQNLRGGYLKVAMDNNIPVSAKTLLEMVARAPANNTASIRMGYDQKSLRTVSDDFFDEFEDTMGRLRSSVVSTADKVQSTDTTELAKLTELRRGIDKISRDYYEKKANFGLRNYGHTKEVNSDDDYEFANFARKLEDLLKAEVNVDPKVVLENAGIPYSEMMAPLLRKGAAFNDNLVKQIENTPYARRIHYGREDGYRLFGAEDYHEDIVVLKDIEGKFEKSIFGEDFKVPTAAHFKEYQNQLYHVRYGTRAVKGAPDEKAYVLDEMQADIQQGMRDKVRQAKGDRDVRLNPTNMNYVLPLFKDKRISKFQEIDDHLRETIQVKGRFDEDDYKKSKKLFEEYAQVVKDTKNNSTSIATRNELRARYNSALGDFQPLFDTERGYAAHGMKYLANIAAKNDVEYIAINPVEMVAIGKRGGDVKKFTPRFYGNAKGKAGFEGFAIKGEPTNPKQTAILPSILKRLAKEYNTEAKVIQVAKSDPTKPFKLVRYKTQGTYGNETFHYTSTEHFAAFKTKIEAENAKGMLDFDSKLVQMGPDDPDLYYPAFGLKISPEMKAKPFKLYKKTGGLVVDIFKW